MSARAKQLLGQHMVAAYGLLQAAMEQLKEVDPQQHAKVAKAAERGGAYRIETAITAAGKFSVNIALSEAAGGTEIALHGGSVEPVESST